MSAGIDSTAMQRGLGGGETGIREYRDAASRVGQADGEAGRRAREGGGLTPQRDDIRRRKGTRLGSSQRAAKRMASSRGTASSPRIERAWRGKTDRQRETKREEGKQREREREREREKEKEGGRKGAVYWGKLFLSLFRQAVTPHCPTGKSKKSSRARRQGGCQPGRPINPLSQDRQHFFFLLNKSWSSDRAFGEACQSA